MRDETVLILGGGHAGGTLAALLRQYGYEGRLVLVGDERAPPYQRPPLSKAWLLGKVGGDDLALKPLDFYAAHDIDLRLGVRALLVEADKKQVRFSDWTALSYDVLVLATGASAARLNAPGSDLANVMTLRTAEDAQALKARLGVGQRIAIVGGGYIGLETAASARAAGAEVVVFEREPRLLGRVASPELSKYFQQLHERHGVRFELGCDVVGFEGRDDAVGAVRLADGRLVGCDTVVVGVGARANQDLAEQAGLDCEGGVVVDQDARTSNPSIFAIGDVTVRPLPHDGRMFRFESVPSALEQARQAACAITGRPPPRPETPWNWSDQYDVKLQIAGLAVGVDNTLVRGDPASGRFAVFHLRGDQVRAVEAVNAPPEFMVGKQLVGSRARVDRARLADAALSMKQVTIPPIR